MRAFLAAIAAALAVLIPATTTLVAPEAAYACSCGSDCGTLGERSDVVVGGRVVSWETIADDRPDDPYLPIRVELAVDAVFKGRVPPTLSIYDGASLDAHPRDGVRHWSGAGGACGSFDEDPTGRYVIAGLWRDEDGRLIMNRLTTAYLGDEPAGPDYARVREALAAEFPGAPFAGSGLAPRAPGAPAAAIVAGLALLAGGGALFVATRSRRPIAR